MPSYKLVYFNARGGGEIARLLFAAAGKEYEDVRVTMDEWKANYKKDAPFGKAPFLIVDGKKYAEGKSIGRYLANKFGFAGKTDEEKFEADMYVDCIMENIMMRVIFAHFMLNNEKDKEEQSKKLKDETIPEIFGYLEKAVKPSGFFVGDSMTWADIQLMNVTDMIGQLFPKCTDGFPKLQGVIAKVKEHKGIAAWLEKRPVTEH